MFHTVIVVLERAARVVGRIDEHALHLACVLLFKGFKSEQVVPENQLVVEQVGFGHPMSGVVGMLRDFEQDAGFQPWAILLPNPGQFEFRFCAHRALKRIWRGGNGRDVIQTALNSE